MGNLADAIEHYLRRILAEQASLEIQRRQLAAFFGCVPSQINYVLGTRFTISRGYCVESRRGGGGYIRISRLPEGGAGAGAALGESVAHDEVPALLERLALEGAITRAEAVLLGRMFEEAPAVRDVDPCVARAKMLRTILALLSGRGR